MTADEVVFEQDGTSVTLSNLGLGDLADLDFDV